MRRDQRPGTRLVVVRCNDKLVGATPGDGRSEGEDTAVIGAREHQRLRALGKSLRRFQCHEIRFRPGIGEAQQLHRRESRADHRGQAALAVIVRGEVQSVL